MFGNGDILVDLFGSKARARLLELLLTEPGTRLHVRELVRRTGTGPSSVQRELARLERLGLVASERVGSNRMFFAADHPLQTELRALVVKSAALAGAGPATVNSRIRPMVPAIVEACRSHHASRVALFGSATQTEGTEPRDVDVLVTFEPLPPGMRSSEYLALVEELESILGMPVDVVVSTSVRNPYLKDEIARTETVLYEAA
ncbi:MAG TPA: nucleotidyltransferase domain-containing protein [Coriobacteriia bacterium]|jgi:hypothetical protein